MPELPEVETIRLGLEDKIIGFKITDIEILNSKSFQGDPKDIIGKKITNVFRRAKILGIELGLQTTDYSLQEKTNKKNLKSEDERPKTLILFHLKMSGQVILVPSSQLPARLPDGQVHSKTQKNDISVNREQITNNRFVGGHPTKDMLGELPNKSTRVIFTLQSQESGVKDLGNNNKKSTRLSTLETYHLYFNDQRKFGWVKLMTNDQLQMTNIFDKLGPEPLEKGFTWQLLKSQLQKRKNTPIKVALLDQQIVSGIGNIYASEACFLSQINPTKKVSEFSDEDFQKLQKAIVKTLLDGIKYGGSTKTHFVNADGKKGLFLDYAFVYSREGSPCKRCKTTLVKIKLGGRGTVYCPTCQV